MQLWKDTTKAMSEHFSCKDCGAKQIDPGSNGGSGVGGLCLLCWLKVVHEDDWKPGGE